MSTKNTYSRTQMDANRQWEHIGRSQGCADRDHDLVHEISRRLDALWRYDQFIANAEDHPALQACWRDLKTQEMESVAGLKSLIGEEIERGCF